MAATKTTSTSGSPRTGLYAAISLPIVLIIAVIVGGIIWSKQEPAADTSPLAVAEAPAPGAAGKHCAALLTALPTELAGQARRALVGSPAGIAAWGDPAMVLRCGLPTPAELNCSSTVTQISTVNGQRGVLWLQLKEGGIATYVAADRPVRIALTLPAGAGSEAIQQITGIVSGTMPSTTSTGALCIDGVLPTTDDK